MHVEENGEVVLRHPRAQRSEAGRRRLPTRGGPWLQAERLERRLDVPADGATHLGARRDHAPPQRVQHRLTATPFLEFEQPGLATIKSKTEHFVNEYEYI